MRLREFEKVRNYLFEYVEQFHAELGRAERRHWCRLYLTGLLLWGRNKSIEALAERVPGGNEQAMQQFVNQSPWDHGALFDAVIRTSVEKSSDAVVIFDDTGIPKKGKHSVGVAHQYCGALGKVSNCQALVTCHYATPTRHTPVRGELYLPESWIRDAERLDVCGVPHEKRVFRKKWEIALNLYDSLRKELPHRAVVMDAGYGEVRELLHELDARCVTFVAQIPESHSFWPDNIPLQAVNSPIGRSRKYAVVRHKNALALTARRWGETLDPTQWTTFTLPLQKEKTVRAQAIRVRETTAGYYRKPGPTRWLIIEELSDKTLKYYLSNAPYTTPLEVLIRWAHERWKVEQGYQHLKSELGLDQFQGRSWRGFHHHVILCFMAYCFLQLLLKKTLLSPIPLPTTDQTMARGHSLYNPLPFLRASSLCS